MAGSELLMDTERDRLTRAMRIEVGKYHSWNPVRECAFVVELDARPLALLVDDVALGRRIYEFMSIRRPGDVLGYLMIRAVDVDVDVLKTLAEGLGDEVLRGQACLPFIEFDGCFRWDYDDTPPHEIAWLEHRRSGYWTKQQAELFDLVRTAQSRLRQSDDDLTRHELKLIEDSRHRRDNWPDWRGDVHARPHGVGRPIEVPDALRTAILELIQNGDVRSVSCPFGDLQVWRALVAEQLRRSEATGLPLQRAFGLCGPDSGLPDIEVGDWGGEVHIPYEGACGSDLFILPSWHRFFADKVRDGGKLRWAVGRPCNHVLLRGDHGELACARRRAIDEDWTLYSTFEPYQDCSPFVEQDLEAVSASAKP